MKIEVLSELSYLVRFPGDKTCLPDSAKLGIAAQLIREAFDERWVEVVPVFADLLVTLSAQAFIDMGDPELIIAECLKKMERQNEVLVKPRLIEVPACYDKEFAEDLPEIAQKGGISITEAVRLHSDQTYNVYAMGFCAGYAYMGDVPDPLRQPRRSSPRTKIPVGSIAVADFMTCVYPLLMPGGWHIIGRCPIPFFNPKDQENPTLLRAGDQVRFSPIDKDEFYQLKTKWQK
ncbi:MAG: 5-oxoprolinase subunit PxpB [Desulfobacterales bacterium]|nr:5-oxoprolinase subunit PxpB [Deltaproteobacteria bacterium]NNK93877.1 5-oxoprolinase subunit PxpB [Desulfobacterales bacterium]